MLFVALLCYLCLLAKLPGTGSLDAGSFGYGLSCPPLTESSKSCTVFYPRYPIADTGYGSYSNYLFCQQHGME